MTTYNTAWTTYEKRNEYQSYYATKELATKRGLSHCMGATGDYDTDNYELKTCGDSIAYWIHKPTATMIFVESIRIYLGE